MVLGLIALAATIPMTATSVLGLQEKAESTRDNAQAAWKTEKCHMRCRPTARSPEDRKELFANNKTVLRDRKLYIQLSFYEGNFNHPFTGYYLSYPDSNFDGLVSTISDDPPQLNWIYLDPTTFQVCHGLRVEADQGGLTGPWDGKVCPDGEIRVLMEDWEGFMGVETEEPGLWSLCFDRQNNGMQDKIKEGMRAVELELIREVIKG
ncbi:hypothetical protein DE146DRAFT_751175 [Phaeosphaeria sp. MPI-PUGE-AT-0046c]|nr:hypothetical protein DE146DRAFT_751175 [Phaeosphaeria sp. MPI-PUGE-AT-0046c]